jgi:hypothetical protein
VYVKSPGSPTHCHRPADESFVCATWSTPTRCLRPPSHPARDPGRLSSRARGRRLRRRSVRGRGHPPTADRRSSRLRPRRDPWRSEHPAQLDQGRDGVSPRIHPGGHSLEHRDPRSRDGPADTEGVRGALVLHPPKQWRDSSRGLASRRTPRGVASQRALTRQQRRTVSARHARRIRGSCRREGQRRRYSDFLGRPDAAPARDWEAPARATEFCGAPRAVGAARRSSPPGRARRRARPRGRRSARTPSPSE